MDRLLTDNEIREAWHKADVETSKIPLYIEFEYVEVTQWDRAIAQAQRDLTRKEVAKEIK